MSKEISALRQKLWESGYRPVPIVSFDAAGPSAGKRPLGRDWPGDARRDPPFCVTAPAVAHATNTGILCDGLRALDIDIDDQSIVNEVRRVALEILGDAPTRYRENSPRILLLYRSSDGEPTKRTLAGQLGKIEMLGRGQQFVSHGTHPSGALLQWGDDDPKNIPSDLLPAISEQQVSQFFEQISGVIRSDIAPLFEHELTTVATVSDTAPSLLGQQTYLLSAAAALAQIPNRGSSNWEWWNRVGMALWAATSGSEGGMAAWHEWSSQNSFYDIAETTERWHHYPSSPPTRIGAGTLFHMAREASPGWRLPHSALAPEIIDSDTGADADDLYLDLESMGTVQPIRWLIDGILESDAISLVYGGSGVGKSFVAIDMALSVALGLPWRGKHETKSGRVFYIAGEGHNGLHRRFAAWKKHQLITSIGAGRVYKSASAMRTLDEESVRIHSDRIARICHDESPVLIIVDTLARNFGPGDENATKDMTSFIDGLDYWFRQRFGCLVLIVHHAGHHADRARGSSALRAAVDAEYELVKDETGLLILSATKMKDADRPPDINFRLRSVGLGVFDEKGIEINSAVLVDDDDDDDPPTVEDSLLDHVLGHDRDQQALTVRWVLTCLQTKWMSYQELETLADVSTRSAQSILARLEHLGLIRRTVGKGRGAVPGKITQAGMELLEQDRSKNWEGNLRDQD